MKSRILLGNVCCLHRVQSEHLGKDDPKAKDIPRRGDYRIWRAVLLTSYGRYVALHRNGAKINNEHIALIIQNEIVGFDVAVNQTQVCQVLHTLESSIPMASCKYISNSQPDLAKNSATFSGSRAEINLGAPPSVTAKPMQGDAGTNKPT